MAQFIRFLSTEDVLAIHADTIAHEGGARGLREPGLLESAIAMPRQRFEDRYLHDGLAAMAAAYLYHLAQNHPFFDGNKRTAAISALVFLHANGVNELPLPEQLEAMTMGVAAATVSKDELTAWFATSISTT